MTDFAEEIYDDLVANWDGESYPATIRYFDPNLGKNFDKKILIEIERGSTIITKLGLSMGDPKLYSMIVHAHLEVQDIQNTFAQNTEWLNDIRDVLIANLEARNYANSTIEQIEPFPNNKRHRLDLMIRREEIL